MSLFYDSWGKIGARLADVGNGPKIQSGHINGPDVVLVMSDASTITIANAVGDGNVFAGSSSTFGGLPLQRQNATPLQNGDRAALRKNQKGTGTKTNPQYKAGMYFYSGGAWSLGYAFDAERDFDVIKPWFTNTEYVKYEPVLLNGGIHISGSNRTSGGVLDAAEIAQWTEVSGNSIFKGRFSTTESYDAGNVVIGADDRLYEFTANATPAPFDIGKVKLIGVGNDRKFAGSTPTACADINKPTVIEITAFLNGLTTPYRDGIVYYTGSDTANDTPTYVYHVDNSGKVTTLQEPATKTKPETQAGVTSGIVTDADSFIQSDTLKVELDKKENKLDSTPFKAPGSENTIGVNTGDDTLQKLAQKINDYVLTMPNVLEAVALVDAANLVASQAKEPTVTEDDLLFEFKKDDGIFTYVVVPIDKFIDTAAIKKIEFKGLVNTQDAHILKLTTINDAVVDLDVSRLISPSADVRNVYKIGSDGLPHAEGIFDLYKLIKAEGALNEGVVLTEGTGKQLNLSAGEIHYYDDATNRIKSITIAAQTGITFDYIKTDGNIETAGATEINENKYENAGVITEETGNDNDATFQTFYISKLDGSIKALYGTQRYASLNTARTRHLLEAKTIPTELDNYILLGGVLTTFHWDGFQSNGGTRHDMVFASKWGEIQI